MNPRFYSWYLFAATRGWVPRVWLSRTQVLDQYPYPTAGFVTP